MRLLAVLLYFTLWSDLARQYPPGLTPGLYAGSAAANAAGAGLPEVSGKEKASQANSSLGHDYQDNRSK